MTMNLTGILVLEKHRVDLDERRVLSPTVVRLDPGVVEPAHTHPGFEVLDGLSGHGRVELEVSADHLRGARRFQDPTRKPCNATVMSFRCQPRMLCTALALESDPNQYLNQHTGDPWSLEFLWR
jgi:hypothetical protein